MNCLAPCEQARVLEFILEGMSIRGCARITNIHTSTIMSLCLRSGIKAHEQHDRYVRNVHTTSVEFDELWSYVGKKQKNIPDFSVSNHIGDQYTFIALSSYSKLVLSYHVGKRTEGNAYSFLHDLRFRLAPDSALRLNSDRFKPYAALIGSIFGDKVDYGQIIKNYGRDGRIKSVTASPVYGAPHRISTTFVERNNLTLRMGIRRLARKTNAFSKKLESHKAAIALFIFYYNFCRVHQTLKTTPAFAAGLTDRVWTMDDLVKLL